MTDKDILAGLGCSLAESGIAETLKGLGFEETDKKEYEKTQGHDYNRVEMPKADHESSFKRKPRGKEPALEASVSWWPAGIAFAINSRPYDNDWHYNADSLKPEQVIEQARDYMQRKSLA